MKGRGGIMVILHIYGAKDIFNHLMMTKTSYLPSGDKK